MHSIVSRKEAQKLIGKGWKAVDLHVHTSYSYDVMPIAELDPPAIYATAKKRGMGFVVFTGHDEMDAFEHFSKPDLVRGVEIKVRDVVNVGHTIHTNVFCLSKKEFLELEYIANEKQDIYAFAAYCKKHDLPFVFNHPYWAETGEHSNHRNIEKIAHLFSAIELNLSRVKLKNDLALALAKRHHKPIVVGTDTHSGDVGEVYNLAPGRTFKEWWRNVEKGNSAVVRGDMSLKFILKEVNTRIDFLFSPKLREKELKKFSKYKIEVRAADLFLRFLIVARRYWIGRFILKHVARLIAHSRIPAVMYLRNENKHSRELQAEIENGS